MILIYPFFRIESLIEAGMILRHIESSGRTCYKSEPKYRGENPNELLASTREFVARLIKRGHHSVLEHHSITVRFICDRGVSHELVRHRLASFSQESTRYCDYSGNVAFIIPPWVSIEAGEYDINWLPENLDCTIPDWRWFMNMAQAEHDYHFLLGNGWSPQQARSVLPNSLKTEIVVTANLREWRHILSLRACGTAGKPHPQMAQIMIPLLREFQSRLPIIFDDLGQQDTDPVSNGSSTGMPPGSEAAARGSV